ncbi:hypothetical protein K9L97_04915 [Candidatus Woesearchaeota archaeon]|nr:hypothetical protein [Candidatus Woesearchaeota archaeon]
MEKKQNIFGKNTEQNKKILKSIKQREIKTIDIDLKEATQDQEEDTRELIRQALKYQTTIGLLISTKTPAYFYEINEQIKQFKEIFGFLPKHLTKNQENFEQEATPILKNISLKENIPINE